MVTEAGKPGTGGQSGFETLGVCQEQGRLSVPCRSCDVLLKPPGQVHTSHGSEGLWGRDGLGKGVRETESAFGWAKGRPAAWEGGQSSCPGACCARGNAVGQLVWKQMVEKLEPPRTRWAVFSGQLHAPQLETEVSDHPCVWGARGGGDWKWESRGVKTTGSRWGWPWGGRLGDHLSFCVYGAPYPKGRELLWAASEHWSRVAVSEGRLWVNKMSIFLIMRAFCDCHR